MPAQPATDRAPTLPFGNHLHVAAERCPTCDQPISRDRVEEVKERIQTRERERAADISARLTERFDREKAAMLERARQEVATALETERKGFVDRLAAAREEVRRSVAAEAEAKIATAVRAKEQAVAEVADRLRSSEEALAAARQTGVALTAELEAARTDGAAAVVKAKEEAEAQIASIRAEALHSAESAVEAKLADLAQGRSTAEADAATLRERLADSEVAHRTTVAAMNAAATEREQKVRDETLAAVRTETTETLVAARRAQSEAESRLADAQQQLNTQQASHETTLAQRLLEQRAILEEAQTAAVNKEKSAAFEERLKLSAKVEELQRALEKHTNEELGDGAEIDLFEALKAEFEGDKIERVNKGQPGADILQTVMLNGRECSKIIYDSKNHKAWRNDFVSKLASDQMAAKADHAILATHKFPAGARHLHLQDGVLIVGPARVVVVAQLVRQHIIQSHTLRLSNEERGAKTAELYAFITSERCTDLLGRIDTHTDDLLEIDVKERRAHDITWKRRGELVRSVQRVRAELSNEIGTIIGTAGPTEAT